MWIRSSLFALALAAAPQAWAQQAAPAAAPDARELALAYDRCMATYAVRLTRTAATDEEIYAQATASCASLESRLSAAIKAQLPPARATEMLQAMAADAKPNFMDMLARIRSDRLQRAAG